MGGARLTTVYRTLNSVRLVYQELREKQESYGESWQIDAISPDVLDFLFNFLWPFCEAQRELEGDQYSTLNLVFL